MSLISENLPTWVEHIRGFSLVVRCTLRECKVPSSILGIPNLKPFLQCLAMQNSELWLTLSSLKMMFWFWTTYMYV
jgi:hypothetical protein